MEAFFKQAGENIESIGDSALQLGKDFIEHPLDTTGNFLYDNTVGTIADIGNGVAFTWNYAWDNGDTRNQAEKYVTSEFNKMKEEGGAEYAANITTSMLLGFFGRKVGIKSIDGKQHHSPHTDSGRSKNRNENTEEKSNLKEESVPAFSNPNVIQEMLDKSEMYRANLSYDCSEIAEDLAIAAKGKGQIITLKSSDKGTIEIEQYGTRQDFYYHTVYSDGKYVYDPRYSDKPVLKESYLESMQQHNNGKIQLSFKSLEN